MPKFKVNPAIHIYANTIEVEAETLEEALDKANKAMEKHYEELDSREQLFGVGNQWEADSLKEEGESEPAYGLVGDELEWILN